MCAAFTILLPLFLPVLGVAALPLPIDLMEHCSFLIVMPPCRLLNVCCLWLALVLWVLFVTGMHVVWRTDRAAATAAAALFALHCIFSYYLLLTLPRRTAARRQTFSLHPTLPLHFKKKFSYIFSHVFAYYSSLETL